MKRSSYYTFTVVPEGKFKDQHVNHSRNDRVDDEIDQKPLVIMHEDALFDSSRDILRGKYEVHDGYEHIQSTLPHIPF